MKQLVGRTADFLKTADGLEVAGISLIERTLTAVRGIKQMQIIQQAISEIELNLVVNEEFNSESKDRLDEEFRAVFGKNTVIRHNLVDFLKQEKNGKYRFSICNIKE